MAAFGMRDPITGLMAGSIVFVVCSIGGDMQQDRSTGWRLGTPRNIQFRYQVVGVIVGAALAVYMAKLFMRAYPVLTVDTFSHPEQKVAQWQSAMTYKFVGALRGLTNPQSWQVPAMLIGVAVGAISEAVRKLVKANIRYREWSQRGAGYVFDLCFDCLLVPSPYASSFAGFVEFATSMWFGAGGVVASLWNFALKRAAPARKASEDALPEDMSMVSLVGGGLIAGDSMAALVLGVLGLLSLVGR
ncbi:MAG TPA: OPT/YSL family transporter, partial [Burkholderiales bacterium]|nr:OPT/YSL family transporter [Burkholderiales bacterium]